MTAAASGPPFLFFPDNTVLVNFGLIQRIDLLEQLLKGQGSWCATVADECARSAQFGDGLSSLSDVPRFLGTPLRPQTGAEWTDVATLRGVMASPGDPPTQHMGEAETIAIISRRGLQAVFVTDDRNAKLAADREGIRTTTTRILLNIAVRRNLIKPAEQEQYLDYLARNGRHLPS